MTYETLQYVDGGGATQEVAVQSLYSGGAPMQLRFIPRSHAPSEFHIVLPQPPEVALQIPFKSRCMVWACRQSETGAANSFSGGQMIFQGRRTDNLGSATGRKVTTEIVLSDALWDLKQLTYMEGWVFINGGTTTNPTYGQFLWPDVVLFLGNLAGQLQANGTYAPYSPTQEDGLITTWQQITDIVNYALSYASANSTEAVLLQMGAEPEFTTVYCNTYPVRSQKCLDCLTNCLRPHPGVFTFMDYSTSPPTLHFRNRAAMANTTLPYKSTDENRVVHVATDIQPLPELVPARVAIYYKVSSQLNGQTLLSYEEDVYPAAGGPFLLTSAYSIDISGASTNVTIKNFSSTDFKPLNVTLWRTKVPSLQQQAQGGRYPNDGQAGALAFVDTSPYDPALHPKGFQVVDDNGNAIDYEDTFIYWTDDSVNTWMQYTYSIGFGTETVQAQAVRATVKAYFTYQKVTTAGTGANAVVLSDSVLEQAHSMRVLLTNMPTGYYELTQLVNTGEGIPGGLAQAVYNELSDLQWKLKHEIFQVAADQNTVPTIIQPGKQVINLSGGDPDWETMDAVPQTVTIDLYRTGDGRLAAKHSIECGPVNHLEPGYLIQLYNLFANRNLRQINANQKSSGLPSSTTDLSDAAAKENSVPSSPLRQVMNLSYTDPTTGTVTPVIIDASQVFAATKLNAGGA